jgi:hypothetical protein
VGGVEEEVKGQGLLWPPIMHVFQTCCKGFTCCKPPPCTYTPPPSLVSPPPPQTQP